MKIPEHGLAADTLLDQLNALRARDLPWREGRVFGYTFDGGREVEALAKRAFTDYLSENALDPTVFPSLLQLENDIVGMAVAHLHGGAQAVGNFTSGGTESILLAVKAARDWAREHRPAAKRPTMLLPVTAHAAFHKAAQYLDVAIRPIPVGRNSFRVDVAALRAAIDDQCILMVGSAPSYAHGVIDPIEDMAALAREHGLWLHVDGCIGGFLLPYFERLGAAVPRFDFRVAGVSSISMDLHKYAYCPKGASVVLYRDSELRKYQLFACAAWTGYSMVNTTVQSTKSGGPMAAAWAVLRHLGETGYLELARRVKHTTEALVAGIRAIPELQLLAPPDMSLLAFNSNQIDIFLLADLMRDRGWYVQPQLGYQDYPANIHLSIDPGNYGLEAPFLADLRAAVAEARAVPRNDAGARIAAAFAGLDPAAVDERTLNGMLAMAGIQGRGLPGRMAEINALLNALPAELRARLLKLYVNALFVPTPA